MGKGGDIRTGFLRTDSLLPPYMAYPRFLLRMDLSETTKLIYVLLLDRARLSVKNEWLDGQGNAYVFYTIRELAEDCRKSEMTVKKALSDLQQYDLIRRQRQGSRTASKIFVRIPAGETESHPPDRQNSIPRTDRKLSTSKTKRNNQSVRIYAYEEGDSL